MDFGKEFKHRRIDADISTVKLAKLLGKSRETLSRWMREPENVQPSDMINVLSALKYTPEEAKRLYSCIIDEHWR